MLVVYQKICHCQYLCCSSVMGFVEAKELCVFRESAARDEVGLAYGPVDATMLENSGTSEDDGALRRCLQFTGGAGVEIGKDWLLRDGGRSLTWC
jgi:hypothetical protein